MPHASGDKISDSHTTVISAGQAIVEHAHRDPRIKKIVLGRIDNSAGTAGGNQHRLKIIHERTDILLAITGSGSHQEIRVYLDDLSADRFGVASALIRYAEDNGFTVTTLDRRPS